MAKIYSGIEGIELPKLDWTDIDAYRKADQDYIKAIQDSVRQDNKNPLVGEIIRFPVADGKAQYVVASLRPVELIHIGTWDGYQFAQAHLINKAEIERLVESEKKLADLFANSKK